MYQTGMKVDRNSIYPSPAGFKTIAWTGRDLAADKLFGVDLIATQHRPA